ncbi:MAG: hypothetical protein ABI455_00025 [Candidatus Dormiibacterota bacterium]
MLCFPDLVAVVECKDVLHSVEQFLRNQRVMIAVIFDAVVEDYPRVQLLVQQLRELRAA